MKKYIAILAMLIIASSGIKAQNVNWKSLQEDQNNGIYLNFGYEFGMTTQLGYAYKLNKSKPLLLSLDYSFPMGGDLFDDFKIRFGGQTEIYSLNNFLFSTKAYLIARRYETELVRIFNYGADLSLMAGYYKSNWHIAGEFGYDMAFASNLKHNSVMKESYPEIIDGWYKSTGGYFYYGIQIGRTFYENYDVSLKAGFNNSRDDDENALLPYYAQLGIFKRF